MIRGLFEREVDYLWSRLARAARGRDDQIASLWSRDGDARVTRVVQAAAYAFARVKEKLEDDVPEISHALVASALPEVLRSTPSATIVQVQDARRARKSVVTFDTQTLESRPVEDVPCLFGTCWPVVAAPVHVVRSEIRAREAGVQVLTLRLEPYAEQPIATALPNDLRLFVQTADPIHALDVVHAVCTTRTPLRIRAFDARGHELAMREVPGAAAKWTALEGTFGLLPGPSDRFASGTALRAFFAFPELFGFFDLTGLRAAVAGLPATTRTLELSVRLGVTIAETAMDAGFHLGCTPAVNVFEARTVPLPVRALGPCGSLTVPGHPAREVFHVGDVGIAPNNNPDASSPVRLWETYRGHAYLDDELYLRIIRRAPLGRGPTELRGVLLRPNGSGHAPRGSLQARVLATDSYRTDSLLKGDVAGSSDAVQFTNITRVTPPHPMSFDARLPWRVNAYARMPVAQFGQAGSLAAYLDVHDVTGARSKVPHGADPASAGIVSARRSSVRRVEGDEVFLGDQVDVALDEDVFGGPGATWLIGELLARAITERADFLRYTRTRLVDAHDGVVRVDYGARQGERLPSPFG